LICSAAGEAEDRKEGREKGRGEIWGYFIDPPRHSKRRGRKKGRKKAKEAGRGDNGLSLLFFQRPA